MEWEYKLVFNAEEKELNALGKDKWELVQIGKVNNFYLKRPLKQHGSKKQ